MPPNVTMMENILSPATHHSKLIGAMDEMAKGPQINNRSKIYKYIQQQPYYRHDSTNCPIISFCQKLRHGENLILQIHGNDKDGNDIKVAAAIHS